MAKLFTGARMTTATTGTGTITLGTAVSGYLTFAGAGVANGNVVSYGIKDGANSEWGTGTYTAAGTTLTRTVTLSTNANTAINLSGSAEVYITPRKEDLLSITETQNANTVFAGPSSGGAVAPAFRALVAADIPANAGLTLLATLTASASATLDDTADITATYDLYMFELRNIVPATNNTGLLMRFSEDAGATWKATTYISEICGGLGGGNTVFRAETSTVGIMLSGQNVGFDGINNSGTYGLNGVIYLHSPNLATGRKMVTGTTGWTGGAATPGRSNMGMIVGAYDGDSGAINAVRFLMASGNIASGTIKIYGVKTS
jgi:hypothetical protein